MARLTIARRKETDEFCSIRSVENGLACRCVCLECGEPVMAKQGKNKCWHFSHVGESSCSISNETYIHLYAKYIISQYPIRLPGIPPHQKNFPHLSFMCSIAPQYFSSNDYDIPHQLIKFDSCEMERQYSNFTPDVAGAIYGTTLFVEIAVTHKIEEDKKKKIEQYGLSCVEIDLSHDYLRSMHGNALENEIKTIIVSGVYTRWVYSAKLERLKAKYRSIFRAAMPQIRSERMKPGCVKHYDIRI